MPDAGWDPGESVLFNVLRQHAAERKGNSPPGSDWCGGAEVRITNVKATGL